MLELRRDPRIIDLVISDARHDLVGEALFNRLIMMNLNLAWEGF